MEWLFFRGWPRPQKPPDLTLDLSAPSLGPIKLHSSASRLKTLLGPPASWRAMREQGIWYYPEHGFRVETAADDVVGFGMVVARPTFNLTPAMAKRYLPFAWKVNGPSGPLGDLQDVTIEVVERVYGAGCQRQEYEDDEEILLTCARDAWGIEFSFDAVDRLLLFVGVYSTRQGY